MLRVLLVDDRVDLRQVFASLLDGQPDLRVVAQAGSLAEANDMLEGVDVALLDRGLPDGDVANRATNDHFTAHMPRSEVAAEGSTPPWVWACLP